jgi:hypothetical protein
MAGLDPAIADLQSDRKTMPGSSPGMTGYRRGTAFTGG